MKRQIVLFLLSMSLLHAGDIMVERMQSVVDEVSELRKRYEDAVHKNEIYLERINEQETRLEEKGMGSSSLEHIKALEFENTKLKQAHKTVKNQVSRLTELEGELELLVKEKNRLNSSALILVEKNHSLLYQVTKLKRATTKNSNNKILLLSKKNEELTQADIKSSKEINSLTQENKRLKNHIQNTKQRQGLSKDFIELEKKIKGITKENSRLKEALALSEKIKIAQKNSVKTISLNQYSSLKNENKDLQKALSYCKSSKQPTKIKRSINTTCIDDNPFPTLLTKQGKTKAQVIVVSKRVKKSTLVHKRSPVSGVYRIKGESAIYNAVEGTVVEI